jgi:predicted transcriptional regulator
MIKQEIKTNLINAINQTDNPVLLMEISKLIDIGFADEKVIKLNKRQISDIETAIAQIENGEFLTNEEAKKQSKEWLEN